MPPERSVRSTRSGSEPVARVASVERFHLFLFGLEARGLYDGLVAARAASAILSDGICVVAVQPQHLHAVLPGVHRFLAEAAGRVDARERGDVGAVARDRLGARVLRI